MQIICLGDSITDCGHLLEDFPLGNGYVQILSDMFNKEVPANIIQIKNYGFDGFTVGQNSGQYPSAPDFPCTVLLL